MLSADSLMEILAAVLLEIVAEALAEDRCLLFTLKFPHACGNWSGVRDFATMDSAIDRL